MKTLQRWLATVRRSLKLRLMLVFLLLAAAMAVTFIGGARQAFSVGWRDAAVPLLTDYIDRLAAEVGDPPQVARAEALVERLPITVRIEGPRIQWQSHENLDAVDHRRPGWRQEGWPQRPAGQPGGERMDRAERLERGGWVEDRDWQRLLQRQTADGHLLEFGIHVRTFERRAQWVGWTVGGLLLLTLLAFLYVRRLLRPLEDIRAGAERFGAGHFDQDIPVRRPGQPDELGQLAATINTMGRDIHQMLEAKRALLLAISHELRSPLTRARLHAELLPDDGPENAQRDALLRDLQEMASLISDLLESERLSAGQSGVHTALHREPVVLGALAQSVVGELVLRYPQAASVQVVLEPAEVTAVLDAQRIRLLLRNLLDNALRHSTSDGAGQPALRAPQCRICLLPSGDVSLEVRDWGPGVPAEQLARLSEPFYRPDSARTRAAGGVGLGLYLCRLVAQAHGGTLELDNAHPGLRASVLLPGAGLIDPDEPRVIPR